MYCKFKEGDIVMVKRDTMSYYGATVRKWVCGTVIANGVVYDSRCDGYVYIGSMNAEKYKIRGLALVPIKDLKKISDKKIPKGSYSAPRFNNGDHVLYKGETGTLGIEAWVIDNKPYYNECKIIIKTAHGKYMIVNEYSTRKFDDCRYFDTDMAYKRFCNSMYGMSSREFEYCVNDVAVITNLMKKHEQKLKEVSNMLNDGRIIQYKREGNTITATLYDTKEIGNGSKSHSPIVSASAKCHPDDRFNLETGMKIAFSRLTAKWKLINKKSNLQKFKDGEIWVKTDKENFIDFMAICARQDISWPEASALGFIPNGLINGRPIYVKVGNNTGHMFYQCYPSDSKPVITVPELLN